MKIKLEKYERSFYSVSVGKGDITREQILVHASKRAAQIGLDGLSIGRLAKDLEMSKSGLFAHFKSKQALQLQVLEHEAQVFVDGIIRPALKAPRGEARVRAFFEGWLDWIGTWRKDTGCLFLAAAFELDDQDGPVRQRVADQQKDVFELFNGVIRTAITQGDFREDLDPEQVGTEIHGVLMAFQHAQRLLRDPLAGKRARIAFERIVSDARAPSSTNPN